MADRSVSFDILALDKASEALAKVGKEVTALAEKVDRSSGTIEIDADTAKAQEKIRAVDSQLARLNAKSLRIDADTAEAQRKLDILQAELKRTTDADRKVRIEGDISAVQAKLRALAAEKVSIDVDTAAASAKLRSIESQVGQVDGKDARVKVDADVAGALANLRAVALAVAAIPTAVTVAVGAVGALAGVGAALGVGMGAGIAGTMGLGDAIKAMGEQSTKAGGAATVSASAIRSANQAVVDARRDLVRANEDVGDAEKNLARAQEDAKRAQDSLTDARREAERMLEDYQLRAAGMALSEESAALSVAEAQDRLQKVNSDATSTSLERARAELTVREALQRQNELSVEARRLTEDKTAADAKGVEGSAQVVSAQDKIRDANERVAEAQRNLARANENVTRATEKVAEAITRLHEAAAPKGGGGGGVDKLAEAMDNLGPKAQKFAKYLYDLKEGPLKDLREAGQEQFLPGVQAGLERMEKQLPGITPAWAAFSREVGVATGNVIAIGAEGAPALLGFASASLQGLSPLQGVLQQLEQQLAATFQRMSQSGEAQAAMRAVVDVIGALVPAIPPLVEAGAQIMAALGPGLTAVVRSLADGLTASEPELVSFAGGLSSVLTAIAPVAPELAVVVAGFAAFKRAGGELGPMFDMAKGTFETFRTAIRGTGSEMEAARTKISNVTSFIAGPWGLAIAAGTLVLGAWIEKHIDAARRTNELTQAIEQDSGALGKNTRERVINALESDGALKAAQALGVNLRDLTDATLGNADAQAKVNARLEEVRRTAAGSGHMVEWSANLAVVTHALGAESDAVKGAVEETKRKAEADGVAATAAGQHATALDGTARAADGTTQAMQRLQQTQQEAAGQFATSEQATIRYQDSLDRMKVSVEENGRTVDIHTEKGRANRQALLDVVSAANDHIDAMQRSGAPLSQVTATFQSQREELIRVATQVLGNRDKAQQYIDKLLQVPKNVNTTANLDTRQAEAALATWNANLQAVQANASKPYALGLFVGKSAGGWIPGSPSKQDTVPSMLAAGEFVVTSSAAQQWGPVLEAINSGASPVDVGAAIGGGPAAGLPLRLGASTSSAGGAGGGGTTIYQISLSGVVGDKDAVIREIGSALQQGVARGVLPAGLFSGRS